MQIIDISNINIYTLLNREDKSFFHIPPFQRAYTWGQDNWADLYGDIVENDDEYFIGSMIMLYESSNVKKGGKPKNYQVIDGQQRLTTISILLCAVCNSIDELNVELDDDSEHSYKTLRYMLVLDREPRLILQDVNKNRSVYNQILYDIGLDIEPINVPYAGNMLIYKAYKFFKQKIKDDSQLVRDKKAFLFSLLDKIGYATIADITVGDMSDALQIFSTLNYRGIPLSPADLIKTMIIQSTNHDVTKELRGWNSIIANISEGKEITSDRFFRAYINSIGLEIQEEREFEFTFVKSNNLLKEYGRVLQTGAFSFYEEMIRSSYDYNKIIGETKTETEKLDKLLERMSRLDSSTSEVLLLYLFRRYRRNNLDLEQLIEITDHLIKFYVRRNLLDHPQARMIPRLISKIIEDSMYMDKSSCTNFIIRELTEKSSPIEDFIEKLNGPVYEENQNLTRYMLASICDQHTGKEYTSPWEMKKNKPVWTVEHILPQNKNLSNEWIVMIANGDSSKAQAIQLEYVHKLGNLTLSGNNSSLSDAPFVKKRDAEKEGIKIGYKNGLWLNSDLAKYDCWNQELIITRGKWMVKEIVSLFKFESETMPELD